MNGAPCPPTLQFSIFESVESEGNVKLMCCWLAPDYWMQWFVGSAKKDSYSEDFAEDSCANTSYKCAEAKMKTVHMGASSQLVLLTATILTVNLPCELTHGPLLQPLRFAC